MNPEAWSTDGQTFRYEAPIAASLPLGTFVVIETDGGPYLGQILERGEARNQARDGSAVEGFGRLIKGNSGTDLLEPGEQGFQRTSMSPADEQVLADAGLLEAEGTIEIGSVRVGDDVAPARLRTTGFTRHTFLCGQSGSGKTYATGTILERLIAETSLRMVIFDPNGDYRRIIEPHDGSDDERADSLRRASGNVTIHTADGSPGPPKVRLKELSPEAQMALLRIDPVRDRDEVAAFQGLLDRRAAGEQASALLHLLSDPDNAEPLARRARALGLTSWDTWALENESVIDHLADRNEVHVLDLSGCARPQEGYAVAASVLDHLWEHREDRIPTLIVVDEAHNLCTATPDDPLQSHVTDRLVQIAGEGRKFGLHLLMATQRPAKLHPNVMSQCDNLILLRMNAPGDLTEIRELFGFAPAGLVERSVNFTQGEALVAGPISPVPQLLRFGGRISHEGGIDIPADWLHPRARG